MDRTFVGQSSPRGGVSLRNPVSQASVERLLIACIRCGMTPEALLYFKRIVEVTMRDCLQPTPLIHVKIK